VFILDPVCALANEVAPSTSAPAATAVIIVFIMFNLQLASFSRQTPVWVKPLWTTFVRLSAWPGAICRLRKQHMTSPRVPYSIRHESVKE
jgi:hypothetical protein